MRQIILLIVFAAIVTSCGDDTGKKSDEGVITYNITYPESISNNGLSAFLPDEMVTTFKKNHFKIHLNGEFNIYNLEYISRSNGDTCFTLLKILDKKLYYPQKEGEKLFLFYKHTEPKLSFFKDSVKTIAGLNCHKGIATFKNSAIPEMEFYYTQDLDFEVPNANTPFKDVPGTMLEFTINYKGIDLAFKANSVKLKEIKGEEFLVPKNYRETDANEINEIVSSLMQL